MPKSDSCTSNGGFSHITPGTRNKREDKNVTLSCYFRVLCCAALRLIVPIPMHLSKCDVNRNPFTFCEQTLHSSKWAGSLPGMLPKMSVCRVVVATVGLGVGWVVVVSVAATGESTSVGSVAGHLTSTPYVLMSCSNSFVS